MKLKHLLGIAFAALVGCFVAYQLLNKKDNGNTTPVSDDNVRGVPPQKKSEQDSFAESEEKCDATMHQVYENMSSRKDEAKEILADIHDDMKKAEEIIRACVKASKVPVSVKFRLGYDKDISLDFGRMCEENGASFVALHARTSEMGYSGKADYDAVARLKANLSIPVVGNGDVVDKESYQRMLSTGVDGVMIGRGAQGKPWIFDELKGKDFKGDKFGVVKHHVDILRKHYEEEWLTLYLRKHFLWYASGYEGASKIRLALATSPSVDESLKILEELMSN